MSKVRRRRRHGLAWASAAEACPASSRRVGGRGHPSVPTPAPGVQQVCDGKLFQNVPDLQAMRKAEAAGDDKFPVKIKLVAPPLYVLNPPALDKIEEGIQLVSEAICSGIFNDLGSGSNVDGCVITKFHWEGKIR